MKIRVEVKAVKGVETFHRIHIVEREQFNSDLLFVETTDHELGQFVGLPENCTDFIFQWLDKTYLASVEFEYSLNKGKPVDHSSDYMVNGVHVTFKLEVDK